ncbi:MAG TPA: hypothetical protein VK233_04700 [Candidatus Dormibacteraeota bacterium]|nr:hypothetical protein [Candidatus Dormibacteraeota bacterium]
MPLQALIIPFVVIALVAIVWRFLPRSAEGSIRLPTVIDESVGMWFVRSALGRATDPADPGDLTLPEPAEDEIAYRIGVPGAPPPTLPTRVVVSQASSNAEPVLSSPRQGAIAPTGRAAEGPVGRRRTARPSGALAAQRRWAGAVALVAVIIAVTALALRSRQLDGEVLSATGTPAGSVGQGFVAGEGDAPTDTPAAATDSGSPTDPGSSSEPLPSEATPGAPGVTVGPAATTRVPTAPAPAAKVTPNPTHTPRPTARPTPVATLRPGPSPSTAPSATPAPTPAPTPPPEPSASPSP